MEKQKQLASKSKTSSGSGAPAPLQSAIVSTAGKPPRAQPARARRPPTSDVQAEGGEIIAVGDESEDEWIEVDDDYLAIDEAEKIDMDDEMSEPSLGLGDGQNDNEFEEVRSIEMPKKAGKRKTTQVADGKAKVKRTRAKRTECRKYFKEVKAVSKKRPGEVVKKVKCLHCFELFAYGGGSTTSLNRHKDACPIILNKKAKLLRQGTIGFDPEKPGASLIVNNEYDHEECRKIIAKMIIVHEYPFRMVEHAWFNILMNYMNASYKFIGRKTIRAECMKVYLSEKEILKKQLRSVESISLTCDLWTSNQNLCYLALVAHYIDDEWNMQSRVLNLIVNDGIAPLEPLIGKLRETVKYLKKSPLRMKNFRVVCDSLKVDVEKGLCLDVSTRWSSTHRMLDASILYREALDEYAQQDPNYKWQPTDQEWTLYGRMKPILKAFAEVTTVLSGSNYPTANIFYPYIMNVKIAVNTHAVQSNGENLKAMGKAMLDKFDKYWDSTYTENGNDSGRNKRKVKNNVMVIATILDPRFKMKLVDYCFKQLYGREKGMREAEDIKAEFFDLYATYEVENRQKEAANSNEQSASSRNQATSMSTLSGFQSFLEETNTEPCQSELTCYLEDKTHPMAECS